MGGRTAFVFSDRYREYELAPEHPFDPQRWIMTWDLVESLGLLELDEVRVVEPKVASETDLEWIHTREYVELVRDASHQLASGEEPDQHQLSRHGLGPGDTPAFAGMFEATSRIVGGTLVAAQLILDGAADHAVNIGGGLHHAMPNRASGFCIFNDVAVTIAELRALGLRVAYVDVDAHHGDGVQLAFYNDPGVLTFSVHEDGRYLFPGTGYETETGAGEAQGTKWNVPLPPLAGDSQLLEAVELRLPGILRKFGPDVLVSEHGCDGHAEDPLTHLNYTMRSYLRVPALLHQFAHEHTGGRWIAVGGGGYEKWKVVPRAWAAVHAVAAHVPLGPDTPVPERYLDRWGAVSPVELPGTFGDDINVSWESRFRL